MSIEQKQVKQYQFTCHHMLSEHEYEMLVKIKKEAGFVAAMTALRWKLNCSLTEAKNFIQRLE